MNFKAYHIAFLLSFGSATAQLNDSVFIPKNQLYNQQFEQLWQNPIQFSKLKISDFTETELKATVKELHLKRVQTAENSTEYQFKTQGIYNVSEKLRLIGAFDYSFNTEKNLGYNLTNERTENQFTLQPNYLFVIKKGNWETQNYALKGGLSYQLSNFDLGAVVRYRNQSAFRKNDPRPEIMTADYSGKAYAGYNYKNHQISAFAGYGRKTEIYDVMAVNEFINAPVNTDYFVRFSNGYGRMIYFNDYADFSYRTIDENFGAGYKFQNNKNFFNLNYAYSRAIQNAYGKNIVGITYFEESLTRLQYRLITHNADANYWYNGSNFDVMSNLNFQSITGDNYNLIEQGQNYRMTLDKVSFNNQFVLKDGDKVKLGTQFEAVYNDFSAIDLLGSTYKYVKSLNINLKFNKDVLKNNTQKMNVELGALSYFPISESLLYNAASSNTLLYDNVIKNDHEYDKTKKLGPQIGLQFHQKLTKKTDLKIFTNFATMFAISDEFKNNTNYNGNPNMIFNAGLSLYY